MNKSNYDNYKRTYKKFQSLLAEIMSVISLLFEIGGQISSIFCEKNMSKDIIETLISRDKKHLKNKLENSERIDKVELNASKISCTKDKIKQIKINNSHLEKVNYFHILKSYFCFKDKKTEMINLCNNIIREDMCIERILERFYNLEKLSHHYSDVKKEKLKINKNRGIKGPKKPIKDISNTDMNDLKNEKISKSISSIKLINKNDK